MNDKPAVKLKDFIPWLRSQPPDRKFDYTDTSNCMLCAFFRETQGIPAPSVGGYFWRESMEVGYEYQAIPPELVKALLHNAFDLTCGNVLAYLTERNK